MPHSWVALNGNQIIFVHMCPFQIHPCEDIYIISQPNVLFALSSVSPFNPFSPPTPPSLYPTLSSLTPTRPSLSPTPPSLYPPLPLLSPSPPYLPLYLPPCPPSLPPATPSLSPIPPLFPQQHPPSPPPLPLSPPPTTHLPPVLVFPIIDTLWCSCIYMYCLRNVSCTKHFQCFGNMHLGPGCRPTPFRSIPNTPQRLRPFWVRGPCAPYMSLMLVVLGQNFWNSHTTTSPLQQQQVVSHNNSNAKLKAGL